VSIIVVAGPPLHMSIPALVKPGVGGHDPA
jgi:hypothetical protein